MGLLADIYSYGDSLKRKLNGLLDDPMGTIETGLLRAREDYGNNVNLFANAFPMASDRTVLNSPEQIARFQKQAADKAMEQALAAATVWHGSPHKFDRFDSSKIGTGEGAQAYGHGLYLAESPDVAKQYQDKLTDPAFKYVAQNAAKARINEKIAKRIEQIDPQRAAALRAQVESLSDPAGALYKVDLPDEAIAKMLDWDKPLSQQHPDVQKALSGIESKFPEIPDFNLRKWMDADPLASTWHNVIQRDLGVAPAMITGTLKDRGIPGIRYLDGGSRGAGAGTSNFVVFPGNENMLTILERNGQPVNALKGLLQ